MLVGDLGEGAGERPLAGKPLVGDYGQGVLVTVPLRIALELFGGGVDDGTFEVGRAGVTGVEAV